ncbi:DNA replication protein DnaC [Streptococcus pneumoniae]|nr:DNA replication protein DnaC [Streptococcus pneumoniae]
MAEVEELRVQPQDILAEQSVLGAIFIDESKLVFVREYIESRDFFKYAHRLIFQAMVDLSDRGDAIDATTVRTILDNQGDLQNIGGFSYWLRLLILCQLLLMRSIMLRLLQKKQCYVV